MAQKAIRARRTPAAPSAVVLIGAVATRNTTTNAAGENAAPNPGEKGLQR